MLYDHGAWFSKFANEAPRRVDVEDIIVGKFFPMYLFRRDRPHGIAIKGGGLMRIFAVP